MKKLLFLLLAVPAFADDIKSANDFSLTQINGTNNGQNPRYLAPAINSVWSFNASGVLVTKPISDFSTGGATWGMITGTLSAQTDLQAAFDLKSNLASPTFTGVPAAPTAAPGTNTTQLATTAFVTNAVSGGGAVTSVVGQTGAVTGTQILADGTIAAALAAKSPLAGSTSITTLGTIGTGTWQGTAIGDTWISSATTWNGKQSAITFGTGVQTALGVNIGSVGAPVLLNGAGGTPSAINLANGTFPTLNQNTSGSAAALSVSGQTGLLSFTGITSTNRTKTVRDAADTLLELGGSYTPTGTWTNMVLATPNIGAATGTSLSLSGNSTLSAPNVVLTGTWITGGTTTTNKPHLLIEPAGTTSTNWRTTGTAIGVNAASGYSGNLLDLQVASSSKFSVNQFGVVTTASALAIAGNLTGVTNLTASGFLNVAGDVQFGKTVTPAGTTGAQTINKTSGSVNFAAGATTLVVTNSLVSATSVVQVTVTGNDITAKTAICTKAAGSITIRLNAAATAETSVDFLITN